ncbi:potassium transporter TrkH [Kiloniella litopenaei]|uniref:Trk system potassium uptake protein n=1 Tax=Kiloniella litopenaei TaxID=1549748 RepID=A0A0M2R738_9PROT|nr:TrkH family potassium uptake protein [Kiloniella litopenaei]KKJ75348.1 potassium transporter TrkH [Kiloniella litopenaei]
MLDFRPILTTLGVLLCSLSALMLIPAVVDISKQNPDWIIFSICASFTMACGGTLYLSNRTNKIYEINLRQAYLLTLLCWIIVPAFSAIPLIGLKISYTDAFFETMSAMTTTGSTVLTNLDTLPPGILMWRSLLQWIGGIGIIAMAIFILPFIRSGGMQLFATESSDNSVKVLPRAYLLAAWLLSIYISLTIICMVLFYWSGMTIFDAVNHAMTTISTGGFSTHDTSFGYFKNATTQWICILFMILGALPFTLYIQSLRKGSKPLLSDPQVKGFLLVVTSISVALAIWLKSSQHINFFDALTLSTFNVVSIVTTTGYASDNYLTWGAAAGSIFLVITLVGGCTGSTSGAIKIYRFQILWLIVKNHTHSLISPNRILSPTYNGRNITEDVQRSVLAFLAVFFTTTFIATVILGVVGLDPLTSFTASVTAITNVGPGLGTIIGPDGNFASLPDIAKWVLSIVMLIGRLEIFTVLVVLMPSFWV